jgi:phage virion morphogenesis protein
MLTIELDTEDTRRVIRKAIQSLEDMRPIYSSIGEYLVAAHRQRFIDGKDPEGKAWAAKSPATLERYRRLGYGRLYKPLWGHGGLLRVQIDSFVSRDGVVVGSRLKYAAVMQNGARRGQFGTTKRGAPIPWGNIPARKWLGLSTKDERAIVEIVEERLAKDLGG